MHNRWLSLAGTEDKGKRICRRKWLVVQKETEPLPTTQTHPTQVPPPLPGPQLPQVTFGHRLSACKRRSLDLATSSSCGRSRKLTPWLSTTNCLAQPRYSIARPPSALGCPLSITTTRNRCNIHQQGRLNGRQRPSETSADAPHKLVLVPSHSTQIYRPTVQEAPHPQGATGTITVALLNADHPRGCANKRRPAPHRMLTMSLTIRAIYSGYQPICTPKSHQQSSGRSLRSTPRRAQMVRCHLSAPYPARPA